MKTKKFRVWDKLEQRFIYPDKGYQGHFIIDLNGRFHNLQNGSGGDEYVVQQYIGLDDVNGTPIYEGDIVENTASYQEYCSPAAVSMSVYEEIRWAFFIKFQEIESYHECLKQNFNGVDLYEDLPVSYFHNNSYKVIGNIFEDIEIFK